MNMRWRCLSRQTSFDTIQNDLYIMSDACFGMERLFGIPDDYQRYLSDVLFYMKYHGKYTFEEIMSMPVYYRDRQVELLTKQLERESGEKTTEAKEANLNAKQLKALREKGFQDDVKAFLASNPTSVAGVPISNPKQPRGNPDASMQNKPSKLKSPF